MLLHILCSVMFGIKYVHVSHVATSEFELTALTSSLDLHLMDGYVQGNYSTKENSKVHSLLMERVNIKYTVC